MRHIDLFSGIGGFALAAEMIWDGVEHIFCDNEPFAQEILKKHWPHSKIYGDIRTLTADAHWERHVHRQSQIFPTEKPHEARRTIAISGLKCYASSANSIRGGSSVKMLAALLLGTGAWYSNKSTLTWKVRDTKSRRLLFQLSPRTLRTGETESGLLLTPSVVNIEGGKDRLAKRTAYRKSIGRQFVPGGLAEQLSMLPSPRVSEAEGAPVKNVVFQNGAFSRVNKKGVRFGVKVKDVLAMMPTPNARDTRGMSIKRDRVPDIVEGHNLPNGQKTGLKLQPTFVEWMMGYPKDWTAIPDSKLLEMRSSRRSERKS